MLPARFRTWIKEGPIMSTITTTYPLRGYEPQVPSTTPAIAVRVWGFWATLGWFAVAVGAAAASEFLTGFFFAVWWAIAYPNVPIDFESAVFAHLSTAISVPTVALVLVLAARRRGSLGNYLGLVWPHWRHILLGLGMLVAIGFAGAGIDHLFPSFNQMADAISEYRAAMTSPVALALFWFTLVVTAPVAEEIIFRGFLMRSWSESRIGVAGAILLSSVIFTMIHIQYNVVTLATVLMLGLAFGVMRWRSGSTLLTMMMHAAWNLGCGITIVLSA